MYNTYFSSLRQQSQCAGGNRADSILFTQRGIVRVIEYFFKNITHLKICFVSKYSKNFPNRIYDLPRIFLINNGIGIDIGIQEEIRTRVKRKKKKKKKLS